MISHSTANRVDGVRARRERGQFLLAALLLSAASACNDWQTPPDAVTAAEQSRAGTGGMTDTVVETYPPDPASLHVDHNQIKDGDGNVIVLP